MHQNNSRLYAENSDSRRLSVVEETSIQTVNPEEKKDTVDPETIELIPETHNS